MYVLRLSAAALGVAALLLTGPAAPALALECAPGTRPTVVEGVEICAEGTYNPSVPGPSFNPGGSTYDPSTGHYSEAVPGVPVPAPVPGTPAAATPSPAQTTTAAADPVPSPDTATGAAQGSPVEGSPSGTPSPGRTSSPSPSAEPAPEEERAGLDAVLPAAAAIVILGVLAGGLLRRHRNRAARR
ncbi:hypothetical protein [Arthrobacter yangruifuii]|uniref:hypothetical protein n=1 Tax=Arthrobacter yangruifuii TaxID=2606616 RepID=UPI0011B3B839|nr:hypothetical protein [Arthrobacter yangruifuii]